jgi:hypothetical protein
MTMKLKLKYDDQNDIPEAFRDLYEEKDGAWHLTGIEGIKTDRDVTAVKTALEKERTARRDLEGKLKKFERLADKDPEELLKALEEVEDLRAQLEDGAGKGRGGDQAAIDAAVKRATQQLQRELDKARTAEKAKATELEAARAEAADLGGRIKRSTIEGELTRAASTLKVRTEALADLLRYQDVFELGDDGEVRTRDNVGVPPGLPAGEWLGHMKSSRPHWWAESVGGNARGSDGKTGGGENPFGKGGNISKAMALMKADPAKAEALAKSAGYASAVAAAAALGRPAKG